MKWLLENYLTSAQCNRLSQIEKTEQGNIFNQNQNQNLFLELKEQITKQVKRLGWNKQKAIAYIQEKYGVSNRVEMSIAQLREMKDSLALISS